MFYYLRYLQINQVLHSSLKTRTSILQLQSQNGQVQYTSNSNVARFYQLKSSHSCQFSFDIQYKQRRFKTKSTSINYDHTLIITIKILCGDFNLTTNSALYSYISQGQYQFNKLNSKRISSQYSTSYHPTDYMQDRVNIQKKCSEFNIETPIQFRSVYADLQRTKSKDFNDFYQKWSTYEPLMSSLQVGCVDYIWINNLQVSQVLQIPKIEYLIENPIVNSEEESDHVPLVCDLY